MKKAKELLLFLILLIIPIVLFFIVLGFKADMISVRPSFVGIDNYIRMFLSDKTFAKALFNTVAIPIALSFLFVLIFALIIFFIRKNIKVPRWVFYLGSTFIGGVTTLIYIICVNAIPFGLSNNVYAAQTIVSHIVDYSQGISDVLFSLYVGILTAFVFWILELLADIVKKFRREREL